MRRQRLAAIGAVATLFMLVACGQPAPGNLPSSGGKTPEDVKAKRYGVLFAVPECTPTPNTCNAAFGVGSYDAGASSLCFTLVDGTTSDQGQAFVTVGNVTYSAAPVGIVVTSGGVAFSVTFQDLNSVTHTASVAWTFGPNGARQIVLDGIPKLVSASDEGFFAGQCTLPQAPCVF